MPIRHMVTKEVYKQVRARIKSATYIGGALVLPDQYDGIPLASLRTVVREAYESPKGRKGSCNTRMRSVVSALQLLTELQGYYESLEKDRVWAPALIYSSRVLPASLLVYSKSPAWWVYESNPHASAVRDSILARFSDSIVPEFAELEDPTTRPINTEAWEAARTLLGTQSLDVMALVGALNARGIDGMRETIHFERAGLIKFEGALVTLAEGC